MFMADWFLATVEDIAWVPARNHQPVSVALRLDWFED